VARETTPARRAAATDDANPHPTRGSGAKSLVVFSDFECPHCARGAAIVDALVARYPDLRVVFHHFPLPFHEHAMLAHEAAAEAYAQGGDEAFWRMHDLLFANQDALTRDDLLRYGADLQLDVAELGRALDDHRHRPFIEGDIAYARGRGVRGTPSFVVDGTPLSGAQPIARFEALLGGPAVPEHEAPDEPEPDAVALEEPEVEPFEGAPPIPPHAARRGPPDAPVVVQVFSDFECPFCARARGTVDRILETWPERVQVVFRHMPLAQHPHAMPAAEAAQAVRAELGDPGFWAFHDELFSHQRALETPDLLEYAERVGADVDAVAAALRRRTHGNEVLYDRASARAAEVRGTPTFFVGDAQVGSSFVDLEAAIDAALGL